MINIKPVFLGVFLWCLGSAGFVLGQDVPVIENTKTDPIIYCSDSVYVAPYISLLNIQIDAADKGMQVSIVNYERGEDKLGYDAVAGLNYNWNNSNGTLEISGVGTDEQYREAIAKVFYYNLSGTRSVGTREFAIGLLDADYLPHTKHFYQYIASRGIRWTTAKTEAENLTYYGLKGYLATITSSIENNFIWSKIDGVGWIGGSDEDKEGDWYWKTGPEAGTLFWRGTSGGTAFGFAYWNNGEPNNVQKSWGDDEDYAHMVVDPGGKAKSWNDLPDEGDRDEPNGYYYPQGYVVEFGGMENLELQLSATAYIEVRESHRPELDYNQVQTLFCGTMTATVDLIFQNSDPQVELITLDSDATVDNGLTSQPTITVNEFGKYYFQLNTIDEAGCPYSDTVMFEFHNQPEAVFNLDSNECYGYNLQLSYTGLTVEETEFTWYYNNEEFDSGVELDSVTIPLGFENIDRSVTLKVNEQGCIATSSPYDVKVKPDIIVSVENPEGCSPLTAEFTASTNKPAESYLWNFNDGSTSIDESPVHTFLNAEDVQLDFDISLTVLDINGCENTAVYDTLVQVYPVPTAGFDFYPEEVLISDPQVNFTNSSHAATAYLWDFGDSIYTNEKDPVHYYTAMGIYDVSLEVANSFDCTDTIVKQLSVAFDKLNPPTAFSPNATNTEDQEFRLYAEGVVDEGYNLLIFNRWGEVVFESASQEYGWDGKMKNGNFAPTGVYTWILEYRDFRGVGHKQQGNVTLLF
ncbi:PKD domain-containing protein [Draconibacterium sp. IB214405]|uniref:PKD domain-containing protein n=1 Tax=Draconibacterium sp. IB214405 TaxID=3097352 RepID=UPI002A141461|nr:PKD domain-containing protein [Draconibacterium sp. IB214405]MDX8339231.1 PKD domain-containing protein [Draconibacterium sp. IB214405]